MIFSSPIFIFCFLPAVFIVYRVLPGIKSKNIFLSAASVIFFSFGQIEYVPIFLSSVLINYFSGILLMTNIRSRKAVLTAAVILNLGILAFFKYTDFFIGNVNALFGFSIKELNIALPIGISFYTFQGLSYTVDVYRDSDSGTKSFSKLLLYISFFPQLIAGPIVKYHDISLQIDSRESDAKESWNGIRRFIAGLSKKLLIANTAGYIADSVFNGRLYADFRLAWLGAVCYGLQIYYDFSGYSDMAIGIGHMFGFTIRENFRHPYGSFSVTEFWRRWHISLSDWFKEYLYIPLGGNRKGKARTAVNRMTVFFCTGLWHGANWTFVFWGLAHGLLTSLENMGVIPVNRLKKTLAGRAVCRVYVLLSVIILFAVFRASSMASAAEYICAMFSFNISAFGGYMLSRLLSPMSVLLLITGILLSGRLAEHLEEKRMLFAEKYEAATAAVSLVVLVICIASLAGGSFNPFIYFQF